MPVQQVAQGWFWQGTKLGRGFWRHRIALEKAGIRDFLQLRRAVAESRLPREGLKGEDLKEFAAFESLTKVFPPHVAAALRESGADGLDALARWSADQFAKALVSSGIGELEAEHQRRRFARFLSLANAQRPGTITGLRIDLGEDYASLGDTAALAAARVETLADWAHVRRELKVSAGAARLLDGYARLEALGLEPKEIKHLLSQNIDSAISLARLSDADLQRIARGAGIQPADLTTAQVLAGEIIDRITPDIDRWVPDLEGPDGGIVIWPRPCHLCGENESVFSKFAYYLYLIERTEKTFHELEITLFQDFSRLTPADGETVAAQAVICNEVLRLALGRNLTQDEDLPARQCRVLAFLRKVVARSPAQIVGFIQAAGATVPADLLPRLIEAYAAPAPVTDEEMLEPQPAFSRSEIGTLDEAGVAIVAQDISAEPAFAGATPQQLMNEIQRLMTERAGAEIEFTTLIRRATFKKALGKTDSQLFAQYFIETNLGLCERTTRLDQAIRTLQAYLTKHGTAAPPYLSFESWRGAMLEQQYPETALLLRDDILRADTDSWDRGSILRNHEAQYVELKAQLTAVRKAIDEARVDTSNRTVTPGIWNNLSKFKDEPYYDYFERGLGVIDDILAANDKIYRAARDLDREEPGLAVGKLQEALSLLDRVDGELFNEDWFWGNQEGALKRYTELLKAKPAARKERLQLQFFNFAQARKKIFEIQQTSQVVAGLTDATVLHVDHPAWTASAEFEQRDSYIVRRETDSISRLSEFRYNQGQNLEDYTFSCEFRVKSYWRSGQSDRSPKIGIGFRLQGGNQGGYRLAVLGSHRVYQHEDGAESVPLDILALQEVSTGGAVTTLAEREIGTSRYTEIEGSAIRKDHWYGLTVTASGGQLTGTLRITPEKSIVVGPVQDPTFDKGTISIFVKGSAKVEFRNLAYRGELETGAPPFFANVRGDRSLDMRSNLSDADYWMHLYEQSPMSQELVRGALATPREVYTKKQLAGVKRNTDNLYLTFPPGGSEVDLDALDLLIERSLMLTYYLRFAAIPVRLAQANLAMGEFGTAADLLHVLYDEEASDDIRQRMIYPFPDFPWHQDFFSVRSADEPALRLRIGEVYLRWAEMLFRQNTERSRYEARRLYERVLRLHRRDCNCVEQQRQAAGHVLALANQARNGAGTSSARELLRRDGVVRIREIRASKTWEEARAVIGRERDNYLTKLRTDGTADRLRAKGLKRIETAELKMARVRGATVFPLQLGNAGPAAAHSLARAALCSPDNPLEVAQTSEACVMLGLLRNCLNILGYRDSQVPPLRFEALLRIARNFADLAQMAERDVLSFRQAFEEETFALMQAQAGLEQASVEVAIEQVNAELAEGEIALAEIQQEQAQAAVGQFESLVSEGMTDTERRALAAAEAAASMATVQAVFSFAAMPLSLIQAGATGAAGMIGAPGQLAGAMGNAFGAQASALGMRASLERQQQDREFQLQQARFGLSIAIQSVSLAFLRWEAAELRVDLAGLRRDFARDAVAFLTNKMLNGAAWLALMKVAREQYRRRLAYAIEAAYLAERALAFELQTPALKVIRFDYYDPRRDGLLGATQLITDLAQLESRKLAFRQRKLQLSKTISLGALFPAAFERFREGSGVLAFSTLAELFDRDFPGHYMRLIQSVRVTVVALVPPEQGIRATLKNSGVSQVVVGPPYSGAFETRTIRRNPEAVALTAPFQASGLFVLDYKDELLLPFEGSGVATDWAFEMPKAANPFNYDTIADIMVTVEYTALDGSAAYRADVLNRIGREFRADRAYSFRHQFADPWYDLHHADLVAGPQQPMVVKFATGRADFPPNLDELKIQHVALYFVRKSGSATEVPIRHLRFTEQGQAGAVGGSATTVSGIISTRQSNGGSWTEMIGKAPFGEWELALPDTPAMRARFDEKSDDRIEDILFVITYSGRTPDWPA